MKPSALLDESKIILDIDKDTPKADIISRLAALALGEESEARKPVTADLLAREAQMTTGIGQGVAIPHAKSDLVEKPAAALGISREGVEFDAVDGEPVHLIFAFATPARDPAVHIQTLAETARLFGDEGLREALKAAGTAAGALEMIKAHGG